MTQHIYCPHCRRPIDFADLGDDRLCSLCGLRIETIQMCSPFQSEILPEPLPVLFQLGDCKIIELVGKGGMGEVYRGWHKKLQEFVAVKVLSFFLTMDPDFIERFEREGDILSTLDHPNIVRFIDKGTEDQTYYYLMELVDGKTLDQLTSEGKLPQGEVCTIFQGVCQGLDYAHQHNLVHRDIKPSNILISSDLQVKISDFGLVRVVNPQRKRTRLTQTGMRLGTQDFIAPEQKKDSKNVDFRADIYSLGVMFYKALTGELPEGRFPLPSQTDGSVDERFDLIVEKALQPIPHHRFETVGEILDILKEIEADLGGNHVPKKPLIRSTIKKTDDRIQRIFSQQNPRILMVDDDPQSLEILSEYLREIFAQVHLFSVENGREAVALALKEKPDVILLDVLLPLMDGIETCQLIRQESSIAHIPILMITAAFDNGELKKDAYLAGTDDFISKPMNFHEIQSKIKKALTLKYYQRTPIN